jgi:hypothetical protein
MPAISFKLFPKATGRSLGGGINGFIPQSLQTNDNDDSFAQNRFVLKQAWNTNYKRLVDNSLIAQTPFRAVNNSGDLLSRQSYSCGGPCQTFQSRPGLNGLKNAFGHVSYQCDETGIPPSACNVKYVYDGSDYTRYKKQCAIVKLYNDRSFGGDESHSSQSAIRAVRRY